jgi:hypothetical protein
MTMSSRKLAALKPIAIMLILPGVAGLIFAAVLSGHYLNTLPQLPVPQQQRTLPRSIQGIVVYQTVEEDQKMDLIEYASFGSFALGLILSLIYMEGAGFQTSEFEEEDGLTGNFN